MSIEDIILSHDLRGISALREYLPPNFCDDAATFILNNRGDNNGTALITTGFFILSAQAPETDGPPGAVALAKALHFFGFDVVYVTDKYTVPVLASNIVGQDRVVEFPITDHESSRQFAQRLLAEVQPSLLISIERAGLCGSRKYLNMVDKDVTEYTAKIDYLFLERENTLGVGDGGNEIGMGNLAQHIPGVDTLPDDPARTTVNKLVIASVSNWGGYGLVAALSRLSGHNLLPSVDWEKEIVSEIVDRGAVDGVSGESKYAVDSFDLEQNAWALIQLHKLLKAEMTP